MTADRTPQAARLTPAGRGAIAVIEVNDAATDWNDGEPALFRLANQRLWTDQPVGRLLYGQWGATPAEDVVVCRTDSERFEIHCHGGDAAVARILADLGHRGVVAVSAEAAAQRRWTVLESELRTALSQALTSRTADLINEQLQLVTGERGPREEIEAIDALLSWADFGVHLTQPWQVVLTGQPNVGKSSLINALLGYQRAIVAEQPGTTRDVVTAVTAFDGWPVQLSDTAGLRATSSKLEAAGIERARAALRSADLQLIVLDLSERPTETDRQLLVEWPDALVVANKCDLPDRWEKVVPTSALRVSSLTRAGLDELQRELVRRLVPRVPPPGTAIPVTLGQINELRRLRSVAAESASEWRPG
ncbi:MAG TPA: GTPase [Planctomycetaceae bacterium]|nr:GTPase [Planctomycetaceae bacterium]